METSDRPDLSLLKPLWSLYTNMLEKEGGEKAIKLRILNGFGSTALERELSAVSRMSIANGLPIVLRRSLKKVKATVSSFWLIFHVCKTVSDCSGFDLLGSSFPSPLFLYNKYFLSWVVTVANSCGHFVNRLWISSNFSSSSPQRPYGTLLSCRKSCTGQYIWLLTQREVNMTGYWSSVFAWLWTEANIQPFWPNRPAWSIEDLFMRETAGNPE